MFASAFGDRKNVIGTEDDICYMIKKQKDAGKIFFINYNIGAFNFFRQILSIVIIR